MSFSPGASAVTSRPGGGPTRNTRPSWSPTARRPSYGWKATAARFVYPGRNDSREAPSSVRQMRSTPLTSAYATRSCSGEIASEAPASLDAASTRATCAPVTPSQMRTRPPSSTEITRLPSAVAATASTRAVTCSEPTKRPRSRRVSASRRRRPSSWLAATVLPSAVATACGGFAPGNATLPISRRLPTSQTAMRWSDVAATRRSPAPRKQTEHTLTSADAGSRATSSPVRASWTRSVPASPPTAKAPPSARYAAHTTGAPTSISCSTAREAASHRTALPSSPTDTNRSPTGDDATARTGFVCPAPEPAGARVAVSNRRTVPSSAPPKSRLPSRENATQRKCSFTAPTRGSRGRRTSLPPVPQSEAALRLHGREQRPVGAEVEALEETALALEAVDGDAVLHSPDVDGVVLASTGQPAAVAGHGETSGCRRSRTAATTASQEGSSHRGSDRRTPRGAAGRPARTRAPQRGVAPPEWPDGRLPSPRRRWTGCAASARRS